MHARQTCLVAILAAIGLLCGTIASAANSGQLEIRVVDAADGQLIPARMHLKDQHGKSVKIPKTIYWHDHFVVPGKMVLELKPGMYSFEIERGPEYKLRFGHFNIERGASDSKTIEMNRFVNMRKEGWYSGDLHVHRPVDDMSLLMRSEALDVAEVITWWNKTNLWKDKPLPTQTTMKVGGDHFYNVMAGEDERNGGALLFFNLSQPLEISGATKEFPASIEFLRQAKAVGQAVHVDAEKPFWWDFPTWIATGQIDSVGICHNHLHRDGLLMNEAWGRPRDKVLYPDPEGIGRYTLDIYYHLLNCGLRIPPSAGSASGVLPNPVGYNRVYVHCGEDFSYENWCAGLKAGRVLVTNGPMIRPLVNGQLPGHVFEAAAGEKVELSIALNLSLREKVDYLEVIQDGKSIYEVRLDEFANKGGELPKVMFEKSGWMLIRAVTNHPKTFRFAMTGPYYVEIGYEKRVSKKSAQFFLDWVYDRGRQIAKLESAEERDAIMPFHKSARDYWQKLVDEANVE